MQGFTNELLQKYKVCTPEEYQAMFGDNVDTVLMFYETFLIQTDHIPNKIIEAKMLNEETKDYTDILLLRKYCRSKINEFKM